MKKYFIFLLSILLTSCFISRMARPAVKGQIFDYQDNPIAHCKVGEVFTDENGYFTLSEI